MEKIFEELKNYWLAQNIRIGKGISKEEIYKFENKYNISIPKDFKYYLTYINGMDCSESWETDRDLITFWPINKIKPLSEEAPECAISNRRLYYVFADYSINAMLYLIQLSREPEVPTPIFVLGNNLIKVADNFHEFIVRYIKNDQIILFPL
jgi:hypothetical protein